MEVLNTDVFTELKQVTGSNLLKDILPKKLATSIVPVIDINPKHSWFTNVQNSGFSTAANTTTTIYTTPTTSDFFLTGFTLALSADATSTLTAAAIKYYNENNKEIVLAYLSKPSVIADSQTLSLSFPPLKIARGTNISLQLYGGVTANHACGGSIWGHLVGNNQVVY